MYSTVGFGDVQKDSCKGAFVLSADGRVMVSEDPSYSIQGDAVESWIQIGDTR